MRLTPAEPIATGYSDRFWVVCQSLGKPLDPIDGVLLEQIGALPWQEAQYISLKAVLERATIPRGLRVHSLEKARIRNIMDRLSDAND